MAIRMNADDQFKFLLSCVKWSVNGKVDFYEVAQECGVVSKGAAAKRYERMLKNHGIHPQGGPLDSPVPQRERNLTSNSKQSRKRKADQVSGSIKHHEDEERKPHHSKRARIEDHLQHEMKQEIPPFNYTPYMYHPMFHPPGPFIPRSLPPNTHPQGIHNGVPYGMLPHVQSFPQQPHAPQPMYPNSNNNPQFVMPLNHQVQAFHIGSSMPGPSQVARTSGVLDEMCNYDFVDGGFESMLHGDASNPPVHSAQGDSDVLTQVAQLKSTVLQPGSNEQVKTEPLPPSASPAPDPDVTCSTNITPPQPVMASSPMHVTNDSNDVDGQTIQGTEEPEASLSSLEKLSSVKQEINDGCIFISD